MTDVFVVQHAPTSDVLRQYTGMSAKAVEAQIVQDGHPFDFLTEEEFATRMAAAVAKLPPDQR